MLYHISISHTSANCPLYNESIREHALQGSLQVNEIAERHGVTLHAAVTAAPVHQIYMLVETENFGAVTPFIAECFPYPSDFTVVPVTRVREWAGAMIRDEAGT